MRNLIIRSLSDFKTSYEKYITFEIIYFVIASFIFVPILSYLLNIFLRISAQKQAVLNFRCFVNWA